MSQYLTLSEYDALSLGNGSLQEAFSDGERTAEIVAQSAVADSYIGNVTTLPLATWGDDVARAVGKLVDSELMSRLSRSPDGGGGSGFILERRIEALDWLRDVARGNARILAPANVDATPSTYEGSSYVVTRAKRGW